MRQQATLAILDRLAAQGRRVLSDWRALILLRRATFEINPDDRRWSVLPTRVSDVHGILRQMRGRKLLEPISRTAHIYRVTTPYADFLPITEEEILNEFNPYSAVSHISALLAHGLTYDLPTVFTQITPQSPLHDRPPVDTTMDDWDILRWPPVRKPVTVQRREVRWTTIVDPARYFGIEIIEPQGVGYFITNRERTLLDALLAPEKCGGPASVLQAWVLARDRINLDTLISYVDRFGVAVLAQRTGFILESLGVRHPELDLWAARSHRGGSSKLIADAPFTAEFDSRWNLSLNGPIDILGEAQ